MCPAQTGTPWPANKEAEPGLQVHRAYGQEGGPGFVYLQRGFTLLKFQITNPKKQKNNNDRNSKIQTISHPGMFWSLKMHSERILDC